MLLLAFDHLLGSFFLSLILNQGIYLLLSEENVGPLLTENIKNDERHSVIFQQDCAHDHIISSLIGSIWMMHFQIDELEAKVQLNGLVAFIIPRFFFSGIIFVKALKIYQDLLYPTKLNTRFKRTNHEGLLSDFQIYDSDLNKILTTV